MKLRGIRVLDLSSFLPGPYLTLQMADHGAEVIKIEPPGGDPGRGIGLADGPHSVFFRNLNRGKRSVCLDLKAPADHAAFLAMVETADVIVESWRPGVAARLGIAYASLSALNPRLVYCSISAFGQDGPYAGRAAHDLAIEAITGLLSASVDEAGRPFLPAIPHADLSAALQGLAGVLMALLARETSGRGDYIDISMQEALVASMLNILGPTLAEGRQPVPAEERTTGGAAFYDLYDTADGRQVALAGQEPTFVRNLLGAIGRPDLAGLCARGPGTHQAPVRQALQAHFARMTASDAAAFLGRLDVCWGPVATLVEGLDDPQLAARAFILRDGDGRRHIGPPVRFLHEPASPVLDTPALDQHGALAPRTTREGI